MFDLSNNPKERDLIDSKQVAEIVEDAKKDWKNIPLYSSFDNPTARDKFWIKYVASNFNEWFERWFGGEK